MRAFLLITFCFFIQACSKGFVDAGSNCGLDENRLGEFVIVPAGKLVDVGIGVSPSRGVQTFRDIPSFLMQVNEVTNLEFDRFVSETGYLTDAERSASSGRLDAGSAVFVSPMAKPGDGSTVTKESDDAGWTLSKEATWRTPEGVGSSVEGRALNPVVHVSLMMPGHMPSGQMRGFLASLSGSMQPVWDCLIAKMIPRVLILQMESHVLIPGRGSFLCSTQTKMGLETTLRSVVSMRTK